MILHPYSTDRMADQAPTVAWLANQRHAAVTHAPCEADTDYAVALAAWWGIDDEIVIVEQDIVPDDMALTTFDLCQWPACTAPYHLRGGGVSLINLHTRVSLPGQPADYIGDLLPVISGLGLVRLRQEARQRVNPEAFAGGWHGLDERLSRALVHDAGIPWHVHAPVKAHTGRD